MGNRVDERYLIGPKPPGTNYAKLMTILSEEGDFNPKIGI
jgi:hypothetical protein